MRVFLDALTVAYVCFRRLSDLYLSHNYCAPTLKHLTPAREPPCLQATDHQSLASSRQLSSIIQSISILELSPRIFKSKHTELLHLISFRNSVCIKNYF